MVKISFKIPLKITRSYLYIITILSFTIFILFPWSVLSYLKFYSLLIPQNSQHKVIPIVNYINDKPYLIIDCNGLIDNIDTKDVKYDLNLYLSYDYNSMNFKKFNTVNYRITIVSDKIYNDLILEKILSFHNNDHSNQGMLRALTWGDSDSGLIPSNNVKNWDLTWDLKIDKDLIKNNDSFGKRFGSDIILFQNGKLYIDDHSNWQWPKIVGFTKYNIGNDLIAIFNKEELFRHLRNHQVVIEFDNKNLRLLSIELIFVQFLTNLKFIIYNYYVLSFIIGVSIFWSLSSIISLIIGIIILRQFSFKLDADPKPQFKAENRKDVKIKREPFNDDSILQNLQDLTTTSD